MIVGLIVFFAFIFFLLLGVSYYADHLQRKNKTA